MILQTTTTPSPDVVKSFSEALVYADSIALGVGVLLLFVAIAFQASALQNPPRGEVKELVVLFVAFVLIGNTAILNTYPDSAVVKAFGYLLAATILMWRFGRAFQHHLQADQP